MQLRLWNMKCDHLLMVVLVVVMECVKSLSDHFFKFLLQSSIPTYFMQQLARCCCKKRQSLNFSLKPWFLIIYTSISVIFYMNNQVKHS